ncbi:hypothetical protein BDR04DRAFT_1115988 [Suillus decipiens]|nr:hypothetical protein BDR04DRAFT_1115988 [Suillus decipiens]
MFQTLKELVRALRDIVIIQKMAVEEYKILHRNCSLNNVMILDDLDISKGFLIDWEFSVHITADNKYTIGGTSMVPFMSCRLLSQVALLQQEAKVEAENKKLSKTRKSKLKKTSAPKTPKTSLDSLALPISHSSSPNGAVCQEHMSNSLLNHWTNLDLALCAVFKITFFTNPLDEGHLLDKFHPYFKPLLPLEKDWCAALKDNMVQPITFDTILHILNSHLDQLPGDEELQSSMAMLKKSSTVLNSTPNLKCATSISLQPEDLGMIKQKKSVEANTGCMLIAHSIILLKVAWILLPIWVYNASPKKKRSKPKASDASKATSSKRHHATNLSKISSMLLVSLSLTEVDATDTAPRCSGCPNAGTGGRNAQLEKIGVTLESWFQNWKPKGATSLSTLDPMNPQAPEPPHRGQKSHPKVQPPPYSPESMNLDVSTLVPSFSSQKGGGRFGFAALTTPIILPGVEPSPQASKDSYLAMEMKVTEKCNMNALIDYAWSSQPALTATLSEHNLDPALCKEDGVSQTLCARLVGSNLEDSKFSSSTTDIDVIDVTGDKQDGDEGDNNKSQQFGWGEAC